MDKIYDMILKNIEAAHKDLAARVKQPQLILGDYCYRYIEKNIHQAIIQKLARIISGLYAMRLLFDHGFYQEQASLMRMLDEFNQDVIFLSYGVISGEMTPIHHDYLIEFYKEVFNSDTGRTIRRKVIRSNEIRNYLSSIKIEGVSSTDYDNAMYDIHNLNSGFVHGESPQIMDMYSGNPPHYHLQGMPNSDVSNDYREYMWNPFFRSVCSFFFAAKAFGDEALTQSLLEFKRYITQAAGENYDQPPKK